MLECLLLYADIASSHPKKYNVPLAQLSFLLRKYIVYTKTHSSEKLRSSSSVHTNQPNQYVAFENLKGKTDYFPARSTISTSM